MKEMAFERDGLKIYGELYLPAGSGPFPMVIMAHGFGGNLSQNRPYAETFAKKGIAAYIFDFIGGGYGSKSDGKITDMSVLTEAADMDAVLDGIAALEEVDSQNIFLAGGSQGGFVASYVAGKRPKEVRGLFALFPAYVLHDNAWKMTPDPNNIPETMDLMGITIGRIYNRDAMSFDIYEVIKNYPGKVLLFHGTADSIVPIEYSRRAAEAFPDAELVEFEGANHGFHGADEQKAIKLALAFVMGNLA